MVKEAKFARSEQDVAQLHDQGSHPGLPVDCTPGKNNHFISERFLAATPPRPIFVATVSNVNYCHLRSKTRPAPDDLGPIL